MRMHIHVCYIDGNQQVERKQPAIIEEHLTDSDNGTTVDDDGITNYSTPTCTV